jgi:hypothetical protein
MRARKLSLSRADAARQMVGMVALGELAPAVWRRRVPIYPAMRQA